MTKKRTGAYFIDGILSTAVTAGVEYFLRKKIKNEVVHNIVTPTAVLWGLEFAQLRNSGQTIGYKLMGLKLENTNGTKLTSKQVLKRMAYRDTISTFHYIKDRKAFEGEDGSVFPHDHYADTVVKEI